MADATLTRRDLDALIACADKSNDRPALHGVHVGPLPNPWTGEVCLTAWATDGKILAARVLAPSFPGVDMKPRTFVYGGLRAFIKNAKPGDVFDLDLEFSAMAIASATLSINGAAHHASELTGSLAPPDVGHLLLSMRSPGDVGRSNGQAGILPYYLDRLVDVGRALNGGGRLLASAFDARTDDGPAPHCIELALADPAQPIPWRSIAWDRRGPDWFGVLAPYYAYKADGGEPAAEEGGAS